VRLCDYRMVLGDGLWVIVCLLSFVMILVCYGVGNIELLFKVILYYLQFGWLLYYGRFVNLVIYGFDGYITILHLIRRSFYTIVGFLAVLFCILFILYYSISLSFFLMMFLLVTSCGLLMF